MWFLPHLVAEGCLHENRSKLEENGGNMNHRRGWVDVGLDGLRKVLERRGKEFAVFELVQNAWDEKITEVRVELSEPVRGWSELRVWDDSQDGFRNLSDAFTLYGESWKKADPEKRGAFNIGEKLVLALCDEATITSTTGQVVFDQKGRRQTRTRLELGTEFRGTLRLTRADFDVIRQKVKHLIPDVATYYNGELIPLRRPIASSNAVLPTVYAGADGMLRSQKRKTLVRVFEPFEGEEATLYEMGIPVVTTADRWHVVVEQKVPLNMERDNVTPAFLAAVRVVVLNALSSAVNQEQAGEAWVRAAASDPRIETAAFRRIMETRFGRSVVAFDPSDIGSNREAASQGFTVVSGGSLCRGEWENARRAGVLRPAGQVFPTKHQAKQPAKRFDRSEWTEEMQAYREFVEAVSPEMVGHGVRVEYIRDPRMVCGQFFGTWFNVNLSKHDVSNWQANIELMLHELAHTVVGSNDHLHHAFYETVGRLGATLARLIAGRPDLGRYLRAAKPGILRL
jgi:hypothetical protein